MHKRTQEKTMYKLFTILIVLFPYQMGTQEISDMKFTIPENVKLNSEYYLVTQANNNTSYMYDLKMDCLMTTSIFEVKVVKVTNVLETVYLVLKSKLDYESTKAYKLCLNIINTNKTAIESTITISIDVIDQSENRLASSPKSNDDRSGNLKKRESNEYNTKPEIRFLFADSLFSVDFMDILTSDNFMQYNENLTKLAENTEIGSFVCYILVKNPIDKHQTLRIANNENDVFYVDSVDFGMATAVSPISLFQLKLAKKLDRRIRDQYELSFEIDGVRIATSQTSKRLRILITDANDNQPKFEAEFYEFNIVKNDQKCLGRVQAHRPNMPVNTTLEYLIVSNQTCMEDISQPKSIPNAFYLNSTTGEICSTIEQQQSNCSKFVFQIKAKYLDPTKPLYSKETNVIINVRSQLRLFGIQIHQTLLICIISIFSVVGLLLICSVLLVKCKCCATTNKDTKGNEKLFINASRSDFSSACSTASSITTHQEDCSAAIDSTTSAIFWFGQQYTTTATKPDSYSSKTDYDRKPNSKNEANEYAKQNQRLDPNLIATVHWSPPSTPLKTLSPISSILTNNDCLEIQQKPDEGCYGSSDMSGDSIDAPPSSSPSSSTTKTKAILKKNSKPQTQNDYVGVYNISKDSNESKSGSMNTNRCNLELEKFEKIYYENELNKHMRRNDKTIYNYEVRGFSSFV